jgi:hypothetical protein
MEEGELAEAFPDRCVLYFSVQCSYGDHSRRSDAFLHVTAAILLPSLSNP